MAKEDSNILKSIKELEKYANGDLSGVVIEHVEIKNTTDTKNTTDNLKNKSKTKNTD